MSDTRGTNPSSRGRHDWATPFPGRTYYQRSGVCVTDRYLVTSDGRYEISELRGLRTGRGPCDPVAMGSIVVAAVIVLLIAVTWPRRDPIAGWLMIVAISLVPLGAAVAVCKAKRRHHELWAEYRGADVRLLDISGSEVFGQICRALIRAREAREAVSYLKVDRSQRNSSAALLMRAEDSSGRSALRRIASNASR